ncbi:MAG: WxL domain-containing protein [Streptococcaceae bacterium]|jgi:hypothetical protein|nr:WxL domain-containing protein [Streptococcaceae bacterium]
MKKTVLSLTLLATIVLGGVASTSAFAADVQGANGKKEGTSTVTFEGIDVNNGGLVLDKASSIVFATTTTGNGSADYVIAGTSTEGITVTDLRGGDEGWTVTAKASDLKASNGGNNYTLPVTSVTLTIADSVATKDSEKVKGAAGADIYTAANKICFGQSDTNGTWSSAIPTSEIQVKKAGVKALTYTGKIEYTLSDTIQ